MSPSAHVCFRFTSSTFSVESGRAEDASSCVRPGMASASVSRGEEEMELSVHDGERMRVSVDGVMCPIKEGKSAAEVDLASLDVRLEVASARAL